MGTTKRFMDRFQGLMRAHGECVLTGKKDGRGKAGSRNRTVKEPVTEKLWEDHLKGKVGLGIVPVDEEGLTNFGAIDIDAYDLDLNALEKKVRSPGFPLIPCETKSGGAHLYLFLKDRAPAKAVRERLGRWASLLGYPTAEIFPKQDRIEKEDDCGSWINLPYFGDSRKAVREGKELSAEEFLDLADRMATGDEIGSDPDLEGAPPCLRALAKKGVEPGMGQNLLLFDVAVFCRKRGEAENDERWKEKALKIHEEWPEPKIPYKEATVTVNSANRKRYQYKCGDIPINAFCDKAECAEAEFGIGRRGRSDPGVTMEDLVRITMKPPTWEMTVNGRRIKLADESELMDQRRFAKACVRDLKIFPRLISGEAWRSLVQDLLDKSRDVAAPDDSGEEGQFLELLDKYSNDRSMAKFQDELLTGKPWANDGKIYFRSPDMIEWMKKKKFVIDGHKAWNYLRELKVTAQRISVKGKRIRVWILPSDWINPQTEPLDVPDMSEKKAEF